MSRMSHFDSPLLLGFDQIERLLDRVSRAGSDGYPPYNIEKVSDRALRITLAVAGFDQHDLSIPSPHKTLCSVGRALEWHSRGRRFDSGWLHQLL